MAGMVPKYVSQLVILETQENGDLVAALEGLMKQEGSAVSRADVLRQALAPGLAKLRKRYEGKGLEEAIDAAQIDRHAREAARATRQAERSSETVRLGRATER